ncbi:MAG: mycothione reductase [Actinomycetota bacterium]|nr:mycothione reductase [Actinomycetota bacterium]
MADFDLAVIGSGSGNSLVGPDFAEWKIAIIEESTFGGTCLNVGCIPTKMYVYPADLAEGARHASHLGVDMSVDRVRWGDIRDRVFGRIDPISAGGREYRALGTPNVTLFEAHARFGDARTLCLSTGQTITADRIVIATGSRAVVPDVIAASGVRYETSDTVMRIDTLPPRIAILGGGYIASEFAHVFAAFGAHTTVVSRSEPLLRHLDLQVAGAFTQLVQDRWHVRMNSVVAQAQQAADGIRLVLGDESVIEADMLLVATGRVPNSDRLDLQAAGLQTLGDGRVMVDEYQRTPVDGIWALGDVSSPYQLKHVANQEARVVAHNLAHPGSMVTSDHRCVPAAVFTHPQIASVGLTEEQAAASGRRYVTAVQGYGSTAYGWAMEDTTSICKLIADPVSGQLLGAHLMGEQAATLIQPLVQAMSFSLGVRDMARGQYWIHPALTEVVENALLQLDVDE